MPLGSFLLVSPPQQGTTNIMHDQTKPPASQSMYPPYITVHSSSQACLNADKHIWPGSV